MHERPVAGLAWMLYHAKDGVVDTYFSYKNEISPIYEFMKKAVAWARKATPSSDTPCSNCRFLDSFFTTLDGDLVTGILASVREELGANVKVRILLADPASDLARARSVSIKLSVVDPCSELKTGLSYILAAAGGEAKGDPLHRTIADYLEDIAKAPLGRNIAIRFYDKVPSGPMFFFGHILMYGRFCAGTNARQLPWSMIIKDPGCEHDHFDVYSEEFEYLWEHSQDSVRDDTSALRVAVFSALDEELGFLLNRRSGFSNGLSWTRWTGQLDRPCFSAKLRVGSTTVELFASSAAKAGLTETAAVGSEFLRAVQPTLAIMIGICAGRKSEGLQLGDLVLPGHAFLYSCGAFKGGHFEPEIRSRPCSENVLAWAREVLSTEYRTTVRSNFPDLHRPRTDLRLHDGSMACGDLVVKDVSVFDAAAGLDRKVVALDMESYAFLFAASNVGLGSQALILKAVSDHADVAKSDSFREYCQYVAAHAAVQLAANLASLKR